MSNVGDNTADDEDDEDYDDDYAGCSDGGDVRYPALVMMVLMMMALITMIMRMPMAIENVMVILKTTDILFFSLFLRCVLSRETPRFSINNMCICMYLY